MAFTDPDLLARLKRRDPDTLREIAETHTRPLYRAARGMGCSGPEAEDLAQDVLVTFLSSLSRFEGRAQVRTWLFGILHNKVHERRRSSAGKEDPIDELFESQFNAAGSWISPPIDPGRSHESAMTGAAIADCIKELPHLQRTAFHLRQVEELSAIEAGNVLGQSVTHVGVLLHRARTRLRECLSRKGWGAER